MTKTYVGINDWNGFLTSSFDALEKDIKDFCDMWHPDAGVIFPPDGLKEGRDYAVVEGYSVSPTYLLFH